MSKSRSCDESAVLIDAGRFGDARRLIDAALEKAVAALLHGQDANLTSEELGSLAKLIEQARKEGR